MAMQHLILPLNKAQLTAGYKNSVYKAKFGFVHYGMDLSNGAGDDRTLWGMGTGTVKAAGVDKIYGGTVVVVYPACYVEGEDGPSDLTVRLYHMASVFVKKGQKVTTATKLGIMGNTGKYSTGVHVHVEVDTDTVFPCYAPGLAKSSNIIKRGTDSTISPVKVLHVKSTPPDNQSIEFRAGEYGSVLEAKLPEWPEPRNYQLRIRNMTKAEAVKLRASLPEEWQAIIEEVTL